MSSIQADIDLCRKSYVRQKKLEEIVSQRQLKRPGTKKWHVWLLVAILPFLFVAASVPLLLLSASVTFKIFAFVLAILLTVELYARFCLIQAVKCYQHYASEETRKRCMCIPSCSEYAIICLKKVFPLTVALIKIRIRLYKTCKGGEYKLDYPFKRMNLEFEKKHLL